GNGAVLDRPEFGVALPAAQVFAVEDGFEAFLRLSRQEGRLGRNPRRKQTMSGFHRIKWRMTKPDCPKKSNSRSSLRCRPRSWAGAFPGNSLFVMADDGFIYFNVFFKNFKPFTAISSRVGSILRQIAAARAMTFTSVVNDSITTSPWYRMALSAAAMDFQSMWSLPGVPRSLPQA